MKQVWSSYSYVIMFTLGLFLLILLMTVTNFEKNDNQYMKVKVESGDSLWAMAEQYEEANMSTTEFIKWVREANNLETTHIKEGQTIVLPIEKNTDILHLADSNKE
ncbi:cell division suppressor protein YneA [Pradoshia sp.]